MTVYAPRTKFFSGGVLVADELMRELNRAEYATNNFDQNNVYTADSVAGVVQGDVIPAGTARSCSFTETGSGGSRTILSATNSGAQTLNAGASENSWQMLYESSSDPLEIVLRSEMTMDLFVACSGTLVASGTGLLMAKVRVLVDGQPLDAAWADSVTGSSVAPRISWSVDGRRVLQPGSHTIRVQIQEKGDLKGGSIAIHKAKLFAYGLVR
tara:strand:- start:4532 stop:5167 length:636 start_codon:yes stop_codon:yes gene_type:complete